MKLSVIIPVYNAQEYIKRCLDSIFNQTFKDFEVICINDGSTDNSLKILQEYNGIKILTQDNQGPASARNYGIKEAQGEYITFIDADDWIDGACFKTCFDSINNEDLLFFNYTEHKEGFSFPNKYYDFLQKYIDKDLSNKFNLSTDFFYFPLGTWAKLIKRSFLTDNNIYFSNGLKSAEDKVFWYEVLLQNPKIHVIDKNLYNYERRENSLTGQSEKALKNLIETTNILIKKDFFKNADNLHKAIMLDWLLPDYNYYWINIKSKSFNTQINQLMDYINQFDEEILKSLKIYPMFDKIWRFCKIPFAKSLYVNIKRIPAPLLKKIKKLVMH